MIDRDTQILGHQMRQRLKEELSRLGLSYARAADAIGDRDPARIKNIAAGNQRVPSDVLARLMPVGLDVIYVLSGVPLQSGHQHPVSLPTAPPARVAPGFEGRLIEERRRLGLTQAQLAESAGLKLRAQQHYEKGRRSPDVRYLAGLSDAGIDVIYLLTGQRSLEPASQRREICAALAQALAAQLAALIDPRPATEERGR